MSVLPLEPHTEAEEARHSLRFRHVEGWTLYSCECGQFDDDAGSDEEARRVYEAHAEHVTSPARGGPDTAGVDPAEIVRQRSLGWPDVHPEDYCHHCGRPNPNWFADTAEWQTATGSTGDGGGILCPSCFCSLWEEKTGKTAVIWRLSIDPRSRDARGPDTAGMLVALSQWIDAGNAHRDRESVLWSRVLKVTEEAGEVHAALSGAIGENPRKGVTHTMADVTEELLDVAVAALAAVEHIRDHDGQALVLLDDKIRRVHARGSPVHLQRVAGARRRTRQRLPARSCRCGPTHRRKDRGMRLPHIHWWRYDGWDFMRGGIYHCRCGRTEYGARR